ncbi:hypothetical protein D3C85_1465300 [compost metagenome]
MVPPTCRNVIIKAEPTPLRSAESTPSAASMAAGSANPKPMPRLTIQMAVKPKPVVTSVKPPRPSPIAMNKNPVACASRPFTAWKNKGNPNRKPKNAKLTKVASVAPQVNLASRNNPKLTSGERLLRCHHTNTHSSRSPAKIVANVPPSAHPVSPVFVTP